MCLVLCSLKTMSNCPLTPSMMLTSDCLTGLTAEDLYHPDPPPVPLAGHLHPRQLGPGEHLRELGVLGAQVLTGGKYLEVCDKNI